jgi:adenine-specific DNA-methyltransferase
VELDGGQHGLNRLKDGKRTKYLEAEGFHVIRFWNHDVFKNLDVVLEQIQQKVQDNPLTLPSPASGRGEQKSPSRLNE